MVRFSRRAVLASATMLAPVAPAWGASGPRYRDARAPVADRVADLLGRMILEEKVAQLCALWMTKSKIMDPETGAFSPEKAAAAIPHGIGQMSRPSDTMGTTRFMTDPYRTPEDAVAFMNAVQNYAVEQTRLGIPLLFHEETAHGLAVQDATNFPIPPALGSTWDPDLVEQVFTVIARQARMRGVTVGLSPVVDLMRDPRWGRSEEFFGEDPYLVGEMGTAAVRGLQGRTRPIGKDRIFATLKHYVHGTPQGGINIAPADMSKRTLRTTYLPPFKAAIKAGAALIMPSYNEVAGVPAHMDRALLQDDGRKLMGFQGSYFSDYHGIERLASAHHVAADKDEAAILAIKAGVDVDLPDGSCYGGLAALVRAGRVPEASIDAAVARVLALKFEAGLFEQPYADPKRAARVLDDPAAAALARKTAEKALVLLKNDGILPLDPQKPLKLAVIGPNSAQALRGGYAGAPKHTVSIVEGLRAGSGKAVTIEQADGVWIDMPVKPGWRPETAPIRRVKDSDNKARIAEAVEVARRSDVIMLVVGDNEQITREAVVSALPGDRSTLSLFGDQDALVEAMLALGKPVIGLLLNGRPLAVNRLAEAANALVEGWYPGEQGGHAVADMLFGRVNPGGKLTVSFPRSAGELPAWYDRQPTADPYPYVEGKRQPLFPFGYGLSYTSFTLSEPRLSQPKIGRNDPFFVELDLTNSGARAGDEVVQLYVRDEVSSVPRPMLELKAFRRITLKPGEKRTVRFDLTPDSLAFWDSEMNWTVEPGIFTISTGNSSEKLSQVKLTVA
ncbi:MAG TPA: glycoside hydrolase family 3 N-terminal domain-containing protein [Sphingobium sp.]|nr:glycoside hydrolase family 3 N-terminal domain-containing protein [Sphingobium sp.]HUD95095.1 glycoside hydrolase family 3 N-terminal domain-containing protein [Sphingobium sp.]